MSETCKHGQLRRSCEICERDKEIDRLKAELRMIAIREAELRGRLETFIEIHKLRG